MTNPLLFILFRWHGTDLIDLGTLGGNNGEAYDIDEAGQSVGWSQLPDDEITHATLWNSDGSTPIDLGGLTGTTFKAKTFQVLKT